MLSDGDDQEDYQDPDWVDEKESKQKKYRTQKATAYEKMRVKFRESLVQKLTDWFKFSWKIESRIKWVFAPAEELTPQMKKFKKPPKRKFPDSEFPGWKDQDDLDDQVLYRALKKMKLKPTDEYKALGMEEWRIHLFDMGYPISEEDAEISAKSEGIDVEDMLFLNIVYWKVK